MKVMRVVVVSLLTGPGTRFEQVRVATEDFVDGIESAIHLFAHVFCRIGGVRGLELRELVHQPLAGLVDAVPLGPAEIAVSGELREPAGDVEGLLELFREWSGLFLGTVLDEFGAPAEQTFQGSGQVLWFVGRHMVFLLRIGGRVGAFVFGEGRFVSHATDGA
jgi:hypothetical protein